MKVMKFSAALVCSTLLSTSCGQGNSDRQPVKHQIPTEDKAAAPIESAARPAELATMLIAKVPVDANGNELNDQAEVREVFTSSAVTDGASAEQTFSGAQNVVNVANELDQDSSAEQCRNCGRRAYYWNTPWYPGKALGRGLWWGRNPYVYYGGNRFPYYCNNNFNFGGYNYYSYSYGSSNGFGGNGFGGSGFGFDNGGVNNF